MTLSSTGVNNIFKCGQLSVHDDPKNGRPSTSRTDDMTQKIERAILQDRRIGIREKANELHTRRGSVYDIIHNDLHMTKVSAHWIPLLLTSPKKRTGQTVHNIS